MSVLQQYCQEAKTLYPAEHRIRKINEIRARKKAGEELTAEQYARALKPVTSEIVKTQDIIRELKSKQQEIPPTLYKIPAIDALLKNENAATVVSNRELPPIVEMLTRNNYDNDNDIQKKLAQISKQLGGRKGKVWGPEAEKIDEELEVIKQYRKAFKATQGTGLIYYKSAKDLVNRLEILMGQIKAGNDSADIQNEASAILDKLLQHKKIYKEDHEKLYKMIYSL